MEIGNNTTQDYVILIHGLGRTAKVFSKMAGFLSKCGYLVHNDDYCSKAPSIDSLVEEINERIAAHCKDATKTIHFVGHSLGAIIVRLLIAKHRPRNLGRVVMLAPPNQGSRLVDFLKRLRIFERLYGPIAVQLGTDMPLTRHLPPPDYEVGIIAGDRSIDFLFSWFILSGVNDGKILVEETKLINMKDHLVLHATHPFMPNKAIVMQQIAYFLQYGKFFR